jgi:hypothetical protein
LDIQRLSTILSQIPQNQATEKQNIIFSVVTNTTVTCSNLRYLLLQAFVQSHGTLLSLFVALFTCEINQEKDRNYYITLIQLQISYNLQQTRAIAAVGFHSASTIENTQPQERLPLLKQVRTPFSHFRSKQKCRHFANLNT